METFFVHCRRTLSLRVDLYHAIQVHDQMILEPHGRLMDLAVLVKTVQHVPPIPTHVAYRVPYAKSPRGQIHWKPAHANCLMQIMKVDQ